ncbi:hypothetical protein EN830_33360, partial [Mesorhizobium sp. M1C.F.Ca.ET.187.01.1.1]
PYSDGERGAVIDGFASSQRCKVGAEVAASPFLPVTIRGEMPGRAMRGSTDFDNYRSIPCHLACLSDVGAAPHLPAGILSPYSDGERALLSEPDR